MCELLKNLNGSFTTIAGGLDGVAAPGGAGAPGATGAADPVGAGEGSEDDEGDRLPKSRRKAKKNLTPAPTKTMRRTSQDMSTPQSRAIARTHVALSTKAQARRLFPSAQRKPIQFIRRMGR